MTGSVRAEYSIGNSERAAGNEKARKRDTQTVWRRKSKVGKESVEEGRGGDTETSVEEQRVGVGGS